MTRKRRRQKPIEILTRDEAQALFRAVDTSSWSTWPSGVRNKALLAVLYKAGLRLGEAQALEPKDVDLARGVVHVLRGKGGRQRDAVIDAGGAAMLAAWLDCRRARVLPRRAPIFCTISSGEIRQPGQPLSQQYVAEMLRRLARRAGIEKRVHPHLLRHTHAVELYEEGKDLLAIMAQLGHENLDTTQSYLDHLSPSARIESLRDRPQWAA